MLTSIDNHTEEAVQDKTGIDLIAGSRMNTVSRMNAVSIQDLVERETVIFMPNRYRINLLLQLSLVADNR
jgi:hypothetical protein